MGLFENKKRSLTIYLSGEFELKEGEISTITLEFGDFGVIKKVQVDGIEKEFIEEREVWVKDLKEE